MLIVDDDEDHRALMQLVLRRAAGDLEVVEAASFDEGRALLASDHYDCALVDLHLPDGDGRELIASAGTTPVVIVTSADERILGNEAISMGAQDFLVKGEFNDDRLQRRLQLAMERKRSELDRVKAEHQHRLAALGRLAGSVGHNINNPASVVMLGMDSIANRLQRMPEASEYREDVLETIEDCREAMQRIVSVVRNLVVVSAPGITRGQGRAFDLGAIVDAVCSLAEVGNKVELRRQGVRLGYLRGRPSEISQALLAVLDNAVRSSPVDGVVTVETRRVGDESVIRVSDQGPGIAREHLARVFEPFFTTRAVGEGTGLGLSVALGVVEDHGGSLGILVSRPGCTTFEIRLPS